MDANLTLIWKRKTDVIWLTAICCLNTLWISDTLWILKQAVHQYVTVTLSSIIRLRGLAALPFNEKCLPCFWPYFPEECPLHWIRPKLEMDVCQAFWLLKLSFLAVAKTSRERTVVRRGGFALRSLLSASPSAPDYRICAEFGCSQNIAWDTVSTIHTPTKKIKKQIIWEGLLLHLRLSVALGEK